MAEDRSTPFVRPDGTSTDRDTARAIVWLLAEVVKIKAQLAALVATGTP